MRRPVVLSLTVAVLSGMCVAGTAQAAPVASVARVGASSAEPPSVPGELLVGYVKGAKGSDQARARGRAGAERKEPVVAAAADRSEVELVRLPAGKSRAQAEKELESDPAVAYAEPNWVMTTAADITDPYYLSTDPTGDLWGMYGDTTSPGNQYGSQAAEAWAAGHGGSRQVYVGVIDQGLQFDHPDLDGNVWENPHEPLDGLDNDANGYVDDVRGWDFHHNDATVYDGADSDDHGTHVSGTIGAEADGQGVVGVNHHVTLISGKFLGPQGGTLANAVRAVDYFTDLKRRHRLNLVATNNSWSGGGYSKSLHNAIGRAAKANILFVAAAGNNGGNNDRATSYPSGYDTTKLAGYDAVIAVAAIDRVGGLAWFSQYGAKTVDLGAPGVGVWSTTAHNTYSQYNGTSMATPHVSGAAALYAAAKPGSSALTIRNALLGSAVPTPSLAGKTVTGGRLDANGALAK